MLFAFAYLKICFYKDESLAGNTYKVKAYILASWTFIGMLADFYSGRFFFALKQDSLCCSFT